VVVLLVGFDTYNYGSVYGLVPIPRVSDYVWNPVARKNIKVWSFPLVNAYSIPLIVTAFGPSEQFVNQSYVVLSRVRQLTDICFEDDQLYLRRFTDYSFMRQAAIILQEYMRLGIYPAPQRLSDCSPLPSPEKIAKLDEDGDAK
jgi:hypothetical protein